jgi:hypothetical protein
MRNVFLFENLILENRLDDVIKKYPEVSKDTIEGLSRLDPSGNNKYLDWMVFGAVKLGISQIRIINGINSFHKNINKLTKEFLDDFVRTRNLGWLLTDNSPAAKIFQNIYNNPKDISVYKDYGLALDIFKTVNEKLSKSEIKKLESNILYEDTNLLILIPKSHKSSCYYGGGTKWCTASKENDRYFNKYTSEGSLIYVINKKTSETNPWYKSAFFINYDGSISVFNAPDKPHNIQEAIGNLGGNWEKIKEIIVNYLFNNKLKGVENFFTGGELLSWYESKDLNPLEILNQNQLMNVIGVTELSSYLKRKKINPFDVLDYRNLVSYFFYTQKRINIPFNHIRFGTEESLEIDKIIWQGFKESGYNPISEFISQEDRGYVEIRFQNMLDLVFNEKVSLDEFLLYASKLKGKNIFELMTQTFNASQNISNLLKLFGDTEILFGYAETLGIDLFKDLHPYTLAELLNRNFDLNGTLEYVFKNINKIKRALEQYNLTNDVVIDFLKKQPNKKELVKILVSRFLIKLNIKEFLELYDNKVEAFESWWQSHFHSSQIKDLKNNYIDILKILGSNIKLIFPTLEDYENYLKNKLGEDSDWSLLDSMTENFEFSNKVGVYLSESFFNSNYYGLYKYYLKNNHLDMLNQTLLLLAYNDAPIEDVEIKKTVENFVFKQYSKSQIQNGKLQKEGNNFYVLFSSICNDLRWFFSTHTREEIISAYCDNVYENNSLEQMMSNKIDINFVVSLIEKNPNFFKEVLREEYLEKINIPKESSTADYFEYWDENNDKSWITFELTDDKIDSLDPTRLALIIVSAYELGRLRIKIRKTSLVTFNELFLKDTYRKLSSKLVNFFDGDKMESIEIDNQNYIRFKYNNLINDLIDYSQEFADSTENLPWSIKDFLHDMISNGIGRFDKLYYIRFDEKMLTDYEPKNFFEVFKTNF